MFLDFVKCSIVKTPLVVSAQLMAYEAVGTDEHDNPAKQRNNKQKDRPNRQRDVLASFTPFLFISTPLEALAANILSFERLHTLIAEIIPAAITLIDRFTFRMMIAA